MEQKDYLLREIEKLGQMLRMILKKIDRRNGLDEPTFSQQEKEVTGWLKKETGFNLEDFLPLQGQEEGDYLKGLKGFNTPNLELLGDVLMVLGTDDGASTSAAYLAAAKKLYSACERLERSYSLERQEKMHHLDNLLEKTNPSRQ